MHQTPGRRAAVPIASVQQRHPRESLSEGVSIGPEPLLQTLAVTSPRVARGSTTPASSIGRGFGSGTGISTGTGRTGRSKLASVVHPSATDLQDLEDEHSPNGSSSAAAVSDPKSDLIDRFRLWRQDAIMQHLYETAIFWGDKVFTWTADPNDAFWLAQAHFLTHHYLRAENILTQAYAYQTPHATSTKGKERDDLLRGNMSLMGGINLAPGSVGKYSRLVDLSVACRYLAAQCSVRLGKWDDALEMLGEVNPFRGKANEPPPFVVPEQEGGVKVESTMCYLRGVIMLRMGRAKDAKESLMEALAIDYKNFDAFDLLVSGEMMTIDEEWEFVQALQYHHEDPFAATFVKSIYLVRLRKYKHQEEMAEARHLLATKYDMSDNPDILLGFGESLFSQYRYADCFAITSRILDKTKIHPKALTLHIACMQYLPNQRSKLFLLAHELMQKEPESPVSSYAVAIWYMFTKKYPMARRWISKATMMDPRNGPAWIAFAHTFALEGEHDQAVTAYSTCARLFRGSHLPLLYIAMEHLRMSNFALAEEYLEAAVRTCDTDPLLFNECGVLAYHTERFPEAVAHFSRALQLANASQTPHTAWKNTYLNLGQAHRKLGQLEEAKAAYQKVVTIDPRSAQGFACLGMVAHLQLAFDDAITHYHTALAISPLDANIIELLNIALASNVGMEPLSKAAGLFAQGQGQNLGMPTTGASSGGSATGMSTFLPPPVGPSSSAGAAMSAAAAATTVGAPPKTGAGLTTHAQMFFSTGTGESMRPVRGLSIPSPSSSLAASPSSGPSRVQSQLLPRPGGSPVSAATIGGPAANGPQRIGSTPSFSGNTRHVPSRVGTNPSWTSHMAAAQHQYGGRPDPELLAGPSTPAPGAALPALDGVSPPGRSGIPVNNPSAGFGVVGLELGLGLGLGSMLNGGGVDSVVLDGTGASDRHLRFTGSGVGGFGNNAAIMGDPGEDDDDEDDDSGDEEDGGDGRGRRRLGEESIEDLDGDGDEGDQEGMEMDG